MINWLKKNKYLGGVLILSAFFRFYRLSDLFFFDLDEEVISFYVSKIVNGTHYPSIGMSAADTGLYLGPYYLYAAAPFFKLFANDPLGGAVFASVLGVVATVVVYWCARQFLAKNTSLLVALFHASFLPIVLVERKFFNAAPIILITALILGSLKAGQSKPSYYLLTLVGIGLILHTNLALIPLGLMALFFLTKNLNSIKKLWLPLILILLFFIGPLIFFDLRHNFQLTQAFIKFIEPKSGSFSFSLERLESPFVYLAKLPFAKVSQNILPELATCAAVIKANPSLLGILLMLLALFRYIRTQHKKYPIISAAFLVSLVFIFFWPGRLQEYYQAILVVPFLIMLAGFLSSLKRFHPKLPVFGIILLIAINLNLLLKSTNPHSLTVKKELVNKIIATTNPSAYTLNFQGDDCYGYGLVYLLYHQNHPPQSSFIDPVIGWLYPERGGELVPLNNHIVLAASKDSISVRIADE